MFSDRILIIIRRLDLKLHRFGILELPMFGISELLVNLEALRNTDPNQTQLSKIDNAYKHVNENISLMVFVEEIQDKKFWKKTYKEFFEHFLKDIKGAIPLDDCYDQKLIIKCIDLFLFLYFFEGKESLYENEEFQEFINRLSNSIFNGIQKIDDFDPDFVFWTFVQPKSKKKYSTFEKSILHLVTK